jgi:hypothetical protein
MPSITSWTRLEPRCRDADMERTVNARVFDPLWMLTRQWQVGEYRGEDAGTPISARVRADNALLSRIALGHLPGGTQSVGAAYDPLAVPLEVMVERERTRPAASDSPATAARLALAVDAGLHLLRLLELQPLSKSYRKAFTDRFVLKALAADALDALDAETRERLLAMAGRAPDARRIEASFRSQPGSEPFIDPALAIAAADLAAVRLAATQWLAWYAALFAEPGASAGAGASAWLPERLEYAVSAAARLSADPFDELALTATEFSQGHLDWEDFDLNREVNLGAATDRKFSTLTQTVMPAPVSYRGAPAVRFWEMEDARVDYALTPVGPADLANLLMIEYTSSYGNDWYLLPLELPVGSITRIRSLVVTDTFGVRSLHRPIGHAALPAPNWSMFQHAHTLGNNFGTMRNLLFLAPALSSRLESPAREEVLFMRDEMANMAWAIERVIESPIEQPLERSDPRADGRPNTSTPPVPAPPPPPPRADGVPYFDLSSDVPEHWVPLLPVQIPGTTGAVQTRLKRGAVLVPDGSRRVRIALGNILATGSELLLRDEEVPREGVRVTRQYEMARWVGGTSFVWAGRKKQVGRGEGASGLAFDRELTSGDPAP